MEKKKVTIVFGGPSMEHEVSVSTAKSIIEKIDLEKYSISLLYVNKLLQAINYPLVGRELKTLNNKLRPLMDIIPGLHGNTGLVLNALHGYFGEDGKLQTLLDLHGVRYTGSKAEASSLAMDKYRSILLAGRLSDLTPLETQLFTLNGKFNLDELEVKFPFVIKPNRSGSSVDVYIVHNRVELADCMNKLPRGVDYIVQSYIENAIEVSCGCLVDKDGKCTKLPPIEIIPKYSAFFDYDAKYTPGATEEITPPRGIGTAMSDRISDLALEVHKLLGCDVYSRSDFLIRGDEIFYLETNTLPGMTGTSLLPQEAEAVGIGFSDLLDFIIENS